MNALAERELHILYSRKRGGHENHDIIVDEILDIVSNGIYEPAGAGAGFGIDQSSIDDLYALLKELGVVVTKMSSYKVHDPATQKLISGECINNPMFEKSECDIPANICMECGKRTDIRWPRPGACDCVPF